MTPKRWAQIEELFHRAAECESRQRTSLLDEACNGDLELRREVETLLASEECASDHMQAAVRGGLDAVGFPLVGATISHYRILEGVGGGGMGLVYQAEDIKLGRRVALKFLPEDSAKDPGALGRFEREARAASALEHPNICPIYEFGEHEGQPFLVMQLLEGQTLRELISAPGRKKLPLELPKLLDLAIQISEGLDAAHRHGIIHRDIKPANIFVTSAGQAKILDFGLAKLVRGGAAEDDSKLDARDRRAPDGPVRKDAPHATADPLLSRTGVAMGTAGYMSPEQARGEKLDARTDLFSFGSVIYEMATGKRAFTGETGPVLREAILKQMPSPVRRVNPELPPKLEKIISKALEKDRAVRYSSASEMRAALETLQEETAARQLPRWKAVVSGGVALVLIASAIFWFRSHKPLPLQTQLDQKFRQLTINSSENLVVSGAISPDGKYLAYADFKGLHVKFIETGETKNIPEPVAFKNKNVTWEIVPKWFPDSIRFLANAHPPGETADIWSSAGTSTWLVSVLGGAPRKIRDHADAYSVSPDGTLISFGTNKGLLGDREIWLMGPTGEQARNLYVTADEDEAIGGFYWSPDGQRAIYEITRGSIYHHVSTLVGVDFKDGPPVTLLSPSEMENVKDYSWLPDGRLIYSEDESQPIGRTCNYWAMRLDARTGSPMEKPKRLTNSTGFCMTGESTTADGKRLAFLEWSGHGTAYTADLEAAGTRLLNLKHFTLDENDNYITGWTSDSKSVFLRVHRGDHYELYKRLLNSDAPGPLLSTGPGLISEASESADGKWILAKVWPVAESARARVRMIRVPISGGPPELIFQIDDWSSLACARPPSTLCVVAEVSEDRRQLIFSVLDPVKGRGPELTRFNLEPNYDLIENSYDWDLSPDGTRIVVCRGADGFLRILSLRGRPTQVIQAIGVNNMQGAEWAAYGKALYIMSLTKEGMDLLHVDLQGNTKVLWKSNGMRSAVVPSPDGRHIAIYDQKSTANMWMMENF